MNAPRQLRAPWRAPADADELHRRLLEVEAMLYDHGGRAPRRGRHVPPCPRPLPAARVPRWARRAGDAAVVLLLAAQVLVVLLYLAAGLVGGAP